MQRVPAHVRDLERGFGRKARDVERQDAQQGGIIFLRVLAQQLHAQTDAQKRLPQGGQQLVEALLAQLLHGRRGLPFSRKQHPVGAADVRGVGRERGRDAQPLQGEKQGLHVPPLVINDDNVHRIVISD